MKQNINKIICHMDMSLDDKNIKEKIKEVWGDHMIYHIHNVPNTNYVKFYEELAESLGTIKLCPPVNGSSKLLKSTDIKPNPDLYHYYSSTTRQPLHTDYSYYNKNDHPDWLMLYCLGTAEYGGLTHILSTKTLKTILEKYNPKLLEKMYVDVVWKYKDRDGEKIHTKPLFDGTSINWNYYQIKEELNNSKVMKIRQELFDFLENTIVDGSMYDFSKQWNVGDCIIFNDHLTLHGRDAFLGNDRWLKDHAFFNKK
jgi:alpha-ketoglutarate-dependent taurine dioxygenase